MGKPARALVSNVPTCSFAGTEWQREPERRAFSRLTLTADRAAVAFDDGAADVETQAQPDTRPALLLDAWHAVESLEEVRLLLPRQPRPPVAHLHSRRVILHT